MTVLTETRRALGSRGFILALAGMVLVIALAGMQNVLVAVQAGLPLAYGIHAQWVVNALTSGLVTLTLPILCTLPYTTAFVDDIHSGYIRPYLHRSGKGAYIRGKLIACGLSGGLVLLLGVLLAYGLAALVFMPLELAPGPEETVRPAFTQIIGKAVLLFFSGGFWSITGFTFAAQTMNRYMAYASPFILYYVLIILHERYLEGLYILDPKQWLSPTAAWPLGSLGAILLLLELTGVLCLIFTLIARRRLDHV